LELFLEKEKGHFALQETVLFHDTILHNVWYGDLKASREEVFKAAEMADIHAAVLRMPYAYDTQVGGCV